jgi:hypothetical protein
VVDEAQFAEHTPVRGATPTEQAMGVIMESCSDHVDASTQTLHVSLKSL